MKKAKIKLDVDNDCAGILRKCIKLKCTPSGRYCIPLTDETAADSKMQVLMTVGLDGKEKRKCVLKLHKQFAHPTRKRLSQLLMDAGVEDTEYFRLVEEVTDDCNICRKYKRTPAR